MSLASTSQTQVFNAIKKYGAPATLGTTTAGTYDPTTGTATDVTTTATVYALMDATGAKLGATFGDDLVRSGDLKATIPAKGLVSDPQPGNTFTVRNAAYSVIAVRPVFVGADPVTFDLLVRR